ncbi:hypothetical protein LTR56_001075 [Elasticomyces elasticus]|nr:hypothetical protein LTR56_001075 [Elasticomyces elasticus]KAK3663476.1 hypothetical protein LTR22_005647 [Elasticomyces elasticus]KAK4927139.1 hypothetical protein LTR49_006055 [Elasticomyces elasticus]KAK5768997.1 hypothetical protein LTS12_000710 [Elasticomyces elasticus]
MAPSRGNKPKTTAKKTTTSGPSRRSTRNRKNEEAPEIFQDLLAEAAVVDPEAVSERPLKRRRVASGVVLPSPSPQAPSKNLDGKGKGKAREVEEEREVVESDVGKLQTIEQSSSSNDEDEEEDEDGFDFEDIDLSHPSASSTTNNGIQDLSIPLPTSTTTSKRQQPKTNRKPGTSLLEKSHRLLVHKAHVLCLLGHCMFINTWCNLEIVQRNLEAVLTEKTKLFLRANSRESQFDRNAMFMDGLQQATEQFRGRFRVSSSGLHRPRWSNPDSLSTGGEGEGVGDPMDRADFVSASRKLAGSQDTGNQLFCAVLRGVGVEARVVCSLQVLPFGSTVVKATPVKPVKRVVYASAAASGTDHNSASDNSADDRSVYSSTSVGRVPGVRRRLGQPSFASTTTPAPTEQRKVVKKLTYPVFWTEAFNPAHQKWIPIDPIVTGTWNKPAKLEPPGSYPDNQMSYVVAFESDGVARDVTRRYVKAFNAKTRRSRVESTEGGAGWWKKALKLFRRRGGKLDREQVEDAEMAGREAREGMPGNVADFKGHPVYALERHLRRGEVVWPRREVGKVNAGTAKKARMEAVYRRQDVVVVRSGEKWYRVGRVIKVGEQALKHVRAAARVGVGGKKGRDSEREGEEEERTTGLYAEFQTERYVPPAVVGGKVPRNKFGNLDVYVPSMVPGGGVHVRHSFAKAAARELGVDFVDAVVGFSFKGRQGTAVVDGGVVAEEFAGRVREVVEGLVGEAKEARERERSRVALVVWGRMMKGLRIRERVRGYAGEGGREGEVAVEDQTAALRAGGRDDEGLDTAGRFTLEDLVSGKVKAQAAKKRRRKVEESEAEEEEEGGFERGDGDEDAEPAPTPTPRRSLRSRRKVVEEDEDEEVGDADHADDEDGGFMAEDADEQGGGFLPDAAEEDDDGSGGFEPEESNDDRVAGGGGFLAEDSGDGGGFMVDPAENEREQGMADAADHGGGGGFLPDADALSPAHLDASLGTGVAGSQAGGPTITSPFRHIDENAAKLANGDDEDDHIHTTVVPQPHASQQPPRPLNGTQDEMKDRQQNMSLPDSPKEAEGVIDTAPNSVLSAEDDVEAQSDQDSLLSHDPEDEDAEPDWLESD